MVNPLESVRVGKNLVERPALNGDHNFLQKIHEHQFDAQDKALATSGVVDEPLDGYLDIVLLSLISSPHQSATHFASHPASQPVNHATPLLQIEPLLA